MRNLAEEVILLPVILCNQCDATFIGLKYQNVEDVAAGAEECGWKLDNPFGACCPDCEPYTEEQLNDQE